MPSLLIPLSFRREFNGIETWDSTRCGWVIYILIYGEKTETKPACMVIARKFNGVGATVGFVVICIATLYPLSSFYEEWLAVAGLPR